MLNIFKDNKIVSKILFGWLFNLQFSDILWFYEV